MMFWKKIVLIIGFCFGFILFAICTETYTVRIPAVFNHYFYSENMWKYNGGNWLWDFTTFNKQDDAELSEQYKVQVHWRPDGEIELHLIDKDTKETTFYIRK